MTAQAFISIGAFVLGAIFGAVSTVAAFRASVAVLDNEVAGIKASIKALQRQVGELAGRRSTDDHRLSRYNREDC